MDVEFQLKVPSVHQRFLKIRSVRLQFLSQTHGLTIAQAPLLELLVKQSALFVPERLRRPAPHELPVEIFVPAQRRSKQIASALGRIVLLGLVLGVGDARHLLHNVLARSTGLDKDVVVVTVANDLETTVLLEL